MSDASNQVNRVCGGLSIVGGAVAATGTLLTWFHLEGQTSGPKFSFGNFTIYQLGNFNSGFWNSIAGYVILIGAVLMVGGGYALFGGPVGMRAQKWRPLIIGVGVASVLSGALRTGLPHWFTMEPLWFTRGPGEITCLVGAGVGLFALLIGAILSVRSHRAASTLPPRDTKGNPSECLQI